MRRDLTESEKMEKIQQLVDAYIEDTQEKRWASDYMEDIIDVLSNDFVYDTEQQAVVRRYSGGS